MRTRMVVLLARVALIVSMVALLPVAGVALAETKWVNPDRTAQQHEADAADCRTSAVQREHADRARSRSRLDKLPSDHFDDCMREKGYTPASN